MFALNSKESSAERKSQSAGLKKSNFLKKSLKKNEESKVETSLDS